MHPVLIKIIRYANCILNQNPTAKFDMFADKISYLCNCSSFAWTFYISNEKLKITKKLVIIVHQQNWFSKKNLKPGVSIGPKSDHCLVDNATLTGRLIGWRRKIWNWILIEIVRSKFGRDFETETWSGFWNQTLIKIGLRSLEFLMYDLINRSYFGETLGPLCLCQCFCERGRVFNLFSIER